MLQCKHGANFIFITDRKKEQRYVGYKGPQ